MRLPQLSVRASEAYGGSRKAISVIREGIIANDFPRGSRICEIGPWKNGNARARGLFQLRESEVKIIRESMELCINSITKCFNKDDEPIGITPSLQNTTMIRSCSICRASFASNEPIFFLAMLDGDLKMSRTDQKFLISCLR